MLSAPQLREIFETKYNRPNWIKVLRENFDVKEIYQIPKRIKLFKNDWNAEGVILGRFTDKGGREIGIYEVTINNKVKLERNKTGLRNLLKEVYENNVDAAFIVFDQQNKWRFSYVSEIRVLNTATGKREKKATDPKRFTYLMGENERCKTAADQFASTRKPEGQSGAAITLDTLEEAFNVEKMSKAFFTEYRKQYGYFTAYITGEDENGKKVKNASPFFKTTFNGEHKEARDFIKKMLGRIVFLYFLEKKGWLGVPANKKWGEGDGHFLSNLFIHSHDKKAFYSNVLVPLFFYTLNTERKGDYFKINEKLFTRSGYSQLKIPYLNGGLFEEDDINTEDIIFPEALFAGLFDFFDQYNFTVYEDSPDEHTVAVDPEMLGHIFENLLEDNKDKGAFYTPKEIVHYMCRESLIEYLYTKLNPQQAESYLEMGKSQTDMFGNAAKKGQLSLEQKNNTAKELVARASIEKLVLHHEAADISEHKEAILKALKEVKICDPAIGSGAFPMGLLLEIFHLVEKMFDIAPDLTNKIWKLGDSRLLNAAKVKEEIIQNSIYGVDIEKGAVDIARLRFWLSLVVDEDSPKPLPNLDYKIVVGNSLLSKFENKLIAIDWGIHMGKAVEKTKQLIKEQELKLYELQHQQHLYFKQPAINKKKLQKEIRDVKIDVLVNQLTLSRIQYEETNKVQYSVFPTETEKKKAEEITGRISDYGRTMAKLQEIKKHKTQALHFFDWKLDFPEVMNEKVVKAEAGFDIVIGNPPYVKVQSIDKEDTIIFKNKFKSAKGKYDLYVIFIESSLMLLKRNGCMTFINPHRFLLAEYGEGLRDLIKQKRALKKVIHFGVDQIFETATTYTGIFLFKENSKTLQHAKPVSADLNALTFEEKDYADKNFDFNLAESNEDNQILKKIAEHPKVSEIFTGVFQGIIPMGDDIQVFEGKIEGKYFHGHSKALDTKIKIESAIVKPLLKGENIQRYKECNSSIYIFYPHYTDKKGKTKPFEETVLKKDYPLAYNYIQHFKKELKAKKLKYKTNPDYWFSLHRSREQSIFESVKIITPQLQNQPHFTIDENKFYPDAGGYMIIKKEGDDNDLRTYLSIFNSKLFYYFIKNTSTPYNNNYYYFKTNYIEPFGIPALTKTVSSLLLKPVNKILSAKGNNSSANTSEFEKEIDKIVYRVYNLTYEEASIVEGNNEWMSKDAYDKFVIN